jgi:hypothetical protein
VLLTVTTLSFRADIKKTRSPPPSVTQTCRPPRANEVVQFDAAVDRLQQSPLSRKHVHPSAPVRDPHPSAVRSEQEVMGTLTGGQVTADALPHEVDDRDVIGPVQRHPRTAAARGDREVVWVRLERIARHTRPLLTETRSRRAAPSLATTATPRTILTSCGEPPQENASDTPAANDRDPPSGLQRRDHGPWRRR